MDITKGDETSLVLIARVYRMEFLTSEIESVGRKETSKFERDVLKYRW